MGNFLGRLLGGFLLTVFVSSTWADVVPATTTGTDFLYKRSGETDDQARDVGAVLAGIDYTNCPNGSLASGYGTGATYAPHPSNPYGTVTNLAGASWTPTGTAIGAWFNLSCNVVKNGSHYAYQPIGPTLIRVGTKYTCPAGYTGPKTVNGQANMCESQTCPAGQEFSATHGKCVPVCPGRQTLSGDGNSCTCNPQALPGRPVGGEWPWMKLTGTSAPATVCDDYCQRNTGFGLAGGGTIYVETTTWTGATCNGTTANNEPPKPNKPPPCGASEGVMTSTSGTVRCVPEGTQGATTPQVGTTTQTVTMPDGSTQTTTTTTTRDPTTGKTNTTTVTTNAPGPSGGTQSGTPGTSTSVTDTGTGGGGTGGNGSGGEGDGDDFCFKHPDSIVCKNNTFSGSCNEGESAPTCDGDAALCATAKAAFELKCGALGKKGTEYGQKLIEGQDDKAGELPDPKNPENHNVGSLNYSDGGGSCPPDLVFHVMGRSTTISMIEVCTIGGWLGNIGVALSLLIGGFIVIGAIRS